MGVTFGRLRNRPYVEATYIGMGHIFEEPDQDAYLPQLTNTPRQGPPVRIHGIWNYNRPPKPTG